MPASPVDEYRTRREARLAAAARLGRLDATIAYSRLGVFAGIVAVAIAAFKAHAFSGLWLLAPALAFVALIVVHDRVIRARQRTEWAARFYADGIARMEDRAPPGDGRSARFADEHHVYAADLDLFGTGSLYERLSTARTSMGEETFADWLKRPAPPAVVRARQQAVAELAPRLDLKEDVAVRGHDLRLDDNPRSLAAWASAPHAAPPGGVPFGLAGARVISAALGVAITATTVSWLAGRVGLLAVVSAALLGLGWTIRLRALVKPVLVDAERRAGELKLLALLLARLERESFTAPLLVELRRALETSSASDGDGGAVARARPLPPSRRVAQLARLVDLLDARRNQIMAILTAPLLWSAQFALAIEVWRRRFGPAVARWLAAVGEIEALVALATYAFEHPSLPFPTVVDGGGGPRFEADALAHPLLPAATRVPNDVALGSDARLLIVSGSNMSGKSTLLRTVGANVVLALAGAPVCARRLTLSPLAIGATLRIHDSLQEGRSRFYAEITRLRQIVDLAGAPIPVLFLLDELLSGTNSHDRRVGAEAIIRGLLDRNAIGIATTHDLALTEMAASLGPRAANVHFEDELRDGKMAFDYRMRAGVVQKSNALALMRAVGLDV
jgi:hypothetical protein